MSPDLIFDVDPENNYDFFHPNSFPQCKYYSVSEYNMLFDNNSLSFINSNVRSFHRNYDVLSSVFYDSNMPSVLCLTETRFSLATLHNLPGFDSFHTIRDSNTPAGGISLYINERLKARKIESMSY